MISYLVREINVIEEIKPDLCTDLIVHISSFCYQCSLIIIKMNQKDNND